MFSFIKSDESKVIKMEETKKPTVEVPSAIDEKLLAQVILNTVNSTIDGKPKRDPNDNSKELKMDPWSSIAELLIPRLIDEIFENRAIYFKDNVPNTQTISNVTKCMVDAYYTLIQAFATAKSRNDKLLNNVINKV